MVISGLRRSPQNALRGSHAGYPEGMESRAKLATRWILGGFMIFAGLAHLLWARADFQAQVPSWIPFEADVVVLGSGIVEIALGVGLIFLPSKRREMGLALAVFFVLVYPGNIAQYLDGIDAFGLDSDAKRLARLFFQLPLILLALWVSAGQVRSAAPARLIPAPAKSEQKQPPAPLKLLNYLLAGLLGFIAASTLIGFVVGGNWEGLLVSLMFAVWSWGFTVRARYDTGGMPDWNNKPVRNATLLMLAAVLPFAAFLAFKEMRGEDGAAPDFSAVSAAEPA